MPRYHLCLALAAVVACGPKVPKCDDPQVAGLLQQIHRKSALDQAIAARANPVDEGVASQIDRAGKLSPETIEFLKAYDSSKAVAAADAKASVDKMTFEYANTTTLSVSDKPPASSCQAEVTVKLPGSNDFKGTVTYAVRLTDEGKLLVQADKVK